MKKFLVISTLLATVWLSGCTASTEQTAADTEVPASEWIMAETETADTEKEESLAVEEVTEETESVEEAGLDEGMMLFGDEPLLFYAVYNDIPVRALPTESSDRIGTLNYRDEIEALGVTVGGDYEEGWFLLSYNGTDGYVWGQNITTEEILAEAEEELRKSWEEAQRAAEEAQETANDDADYITCVAGQYYIMDELLPLVNEDRANNGAAPLVWDDTLAQYALDRLPVIVNNRKSGIDPHTGFAESFPYTDAGGAENINFGGATASDANNSWTNSPTHQTNRTNPEYTRYGAASWQDPEDNRVYWVELFAW